MTYKISYLNDFDWNVFLNSLQNEYKSKICSWRTISVDFGTQDDFEKIHLKCVLYCIACLSSKAICVIFLRTIYHIPYALYNKNDCVDEQNNRTKWQKKRAMEASDSNMYNTQAHSHYCHWFICIIILLCDCVPFRVNFSLHLFWSARNRLIALYDAVSLTINDDKFFSNSS